MDAANRRYGVVAVEYEVVMFANSNTVLVADPWPSADIMRAAITNGRGSDTIWYGTTPLTDPATAKSYLGLSVDDGTAGVPKRRKGSVSMKGRNLQD